MSKFIQSCIRGAQELDEKVDSLKKVAVKSKEDIFDVLEKAKQEAESQRTKRKETVILNGRVLCENCIYYSPEFAKCFCKNGICQDSYVDKKDFCSYFKNRDNV